jgi:hypothetical protein
MVGNSIHGMSGIVMQMQTLVLGFRRWRRCLGRRHVLVRSSDRRQARALLLLIVSAWTAAVGAAAMGITVYDDRLDAFAAQRLDRHEITATAAADSRPANAGYSKYHLTPVSWQAGGAVHTDELRTPYQVKAGDSQNVWVDAQGDSVAAPLLDQDATIEAIAAAAGLWLLITGAGTAAWLLLRKRLDRSRYADWDSDFRDLADDDGRRSKGA